MRTAPIPASKDCSRVTSRTFVARVPHGTNQAASEHFADPCSPGGLVERPPELMLAFCSEALFRSFPAVTTAAIFRVFAMSARGILQSLLSPALCLSSDAATYDPSQLSGMSI